MFNKESYHNNDFLKKDQNIQIFKSLDGLTFGIYKTSSLGIEYSAVFLPKHIDLKTLALNLEKYYDNSKLYYKVLDSDPNLSEYNENNFNIDNYVLNLPE